MRPPASKLSIYLLAIAVTVPGHASVPDPVAGFTVEEILPGQSPVRPPEVRPGRGFDSESLPGHRSARPPEVRPGTGLDSESLPGQSPALALQALPLDPPTFHPDELDGSTAFEVRYFVIGADGPVEVEVRVDGRLRARIHRVAPPGVIVEWTERLRVPGPPPDQVTLTLRSRGSQVISPPLFLPPVLRPDLLGVEPF